MSVYEIIGRAVKTFAQAFISTLLAANFMDLGDEAAKTACLVSSLSAGVSALMNFNWDGTKTQTKEGE